MYWIVNIIERHFGGEMMKKNNKLILFLLCIIGLLLWKNRKKEKEINKYKELSKKHLEMFLLMFDWVKFKQKNKNIVGYFAEKNYRKIAIYGMSYVGKALVNELKNSDIEICYGIDRNKSIFSSEIKMVSMEDCLEEVDAIVVTPMSAYAQIEQDIREKVNCDIISIEDVIYW